jgi:hypothetical protein
MSITIRKRQAKKLARKLAEQLQTVEALCAFGHRQLESIEENGGAVTEDQARAIQSDLEDAERLLAVTAQDVADL